MNADSPGTGTLALTLSPREVISIGSDIEVLLVRQINNSQSVKLAIRAPKSVKIRVHKPPVGHWSLVNKQVDELEETLRMVRSVAAR